MFSTTGSGQQKKAWDSNILYKIDSKYRESNKEVSASSFAEACELNHVTYRRVECLIDGQRYWCSACKSYLKSNDISIPLYNMLYGISRVPGISDAHAKVIRYRYKLLINKK